MDAVKSGYLMQFSEKKKKWKKKWLMMFQLPPVIKYFKKKSKVPRPPPPCASRSSCARAHRSLPCAGQGGRHGRLAGVLLRAHRGQFRQPQVDLPVRYCHLCFLSIRADVMAHTTLDIKTTECIIQCAARLYLPLSRRRRCRSGSKPSGR